MISLSSRLLFQCSSLFSLPLCIFASLRLIFNSATQSFLLFLLSSCDPISYGAAELHSSTLQEIMGRQEGGNRFPVYRIQVPDEWIRRDPLPADTLLDTTKALCEFIILDETQTVRIAIHNFPSMKLEDRIPSTAQVARWQRQFEPLDPVESNVIPQAFSGYSGLLFSGTGRINEKATSTLAWALQLAPEHYRTLSLPKTPEEESLFKQMRADVTIKAIGPKHLMEKYKQTIVIFARSFELILEIPTRT